ncbi:hypothetical protein EDD18DRAFT_1075895, partial [Armillaria luteobubalina]
GDQKNGLRNLELSISEWKVIGKLCDILKVLKDATLFFSCGTPNLLTDIPAIDHIDEVIATAALKRGINNILHFSTPIHASLAIGLTLISEKESDDNGDVFMPER